MCHLIRLDLVDPDAGDRKSEWLYGAIVTDLFVFQLYVSPNAGSFVSYRR